MALLLPLTVTVSPVPLNVTAAAVPSPTELELPVIVAVLFAAKLSVLEVALIVSPVPDRVAELPLPLSVRWLLLPEMFADPPVPLVMVFPLPFIVMESPAADALIVDEFPVI